MTWDVLRQFLVPALLGLAGGLFYAGRQAERFLRLEKRVEALERRIDHESEV